MMSAAVPWMGMFRATRSPKERRLKLEDFSSGRSRRRWNSVSTKPVSRAFSTTASIYFRTPGKVAKYASIYALASATVEPMSWLREKAEMP